MANEHLTPYSDRCEDGSPADIFTQVVVNLKAEREYQETRWGTEFDDQNSANDWVSYINRYTAKACEFNISQDEFEEAMLKVAAIAVGAIETSRRNGGPAARHYDNVPA